MASSVDENLNEMRFVIANHTIMTWGPDMMLNVYLQGCKELIHIHHPFEYLADKPSFYEIFQKGVKIKEEKYSWTPRHNLLSYVKDFVANLTIVLSQPSKYDIFVGLDPLNAFSGLILKYLGKVEKVVFYPIDYSPKRFKNRLINALYHRVEMFCARHADNVWFMGKKMQEIFVSKGIPADKCQFLYVATNKMFVEDDRDRISNPVIAYIGSLFPEKGVDLIIDSMPSLLDKFPTLQVLVIGTGPIENDLRDRAKLCGCDNNITFTGHIASHDDAMQLLSTSSIGTLLYVPNTGKYSDIGYGGKIAEYLACGLPIIITKVPESWKEVEERETGIAIDYNTDQFANAVKYLLADPIRYRKYREASFQAAQDFYYVNVFDKAFGSMGYFRGVPHQHASGHG